MRILIIGKNGQIAKSLYELKNQNELDFFFIGRPEIDLEVPNNISEIIKSINPDIVINAAAYTNVDQAEKDFEKAFLINAIAPKLISKTCNSLNIPIIHYSTDYVFSGETSTNYKENDICNPINLYGKSKFEGEINVAFENPNHVILRTSWVYSQFGNNFVKTMLKLGNQKNEISVVNDQFGSPTYAKEIAIATLKIAQRIKENQSSELRGVFHLSASNTTNWADFAKTIFEIHSNNNDNKIKIIPIMSSQYSFIAKRPKNTILNCEKLFDIYGIKLPDWKTSLKECIEIIKSNNN